jgi:hypothetical protein
MEVDMCDIALREIALHMSHNPNSSRKSSWDVDLNGADQRGIFKA